VSLSSALERLRVAIAPGAEARRGAGGNYARVQTQDLAQLLDDHQEMDARLRTAHFHANRAAYPPRADMLARAASDPGAFAGYKGERSMGRWISDAILAIERNAAPEDIRRLAQDLSSHASKTRRARPGLSYSADHASVALVDQAAQIERLRRILARYGDRVPMAMCHRADWQAEIDDALEWVADNPEPLEGVHHDLPPADAAKLDSWIKEELARDEAQEQ
jgi:hypothetical protein